VTSNEQLTSFLKNSLGNLQSSWDVPGVTEVNKKICAAHDCMSWKNRPQMLAACTEIKS